MYLPIAVNNQSKRFELNLVFLMMKKQIQIEFKFDYIFYMRDQ